MCGGGAAELESGTAALANDVHFLAIGIGGTSAADVALGYVCGVLWAGVLVGRGLGHGGL